MSSRVTNSSRQAISVVIPCYMSEHSLPIVVEEIQSTFESSLINKYEIILVVDNPGDLTLDVARNLQNHNSKIIVVELSRNYGQHAALFAGIENARFPIIVTMDDDGQHPGTAIPELLLALEHDIDVVYGVAILKKHGWLKDFFSKQVKYFTFKFLGVANAREISAFRVFRKSIFDNIEINLLSNAVVDVVLHWHTNRFSTVSVNMQQRRLGKSNYTFFSLTRFAVQIISGYSTRPLRLATILGFLTFIASSIASILLLIEWKIGNIRVPGYTSSLLAILLIGSIELITLGIIGEYVGRIHEKSMGKPLFVIREK